VHLTFVRSVDLDEWTQSQVDSMRIGGNKNAKAYFKKHGHSEMGGKMEKKYKSKAATSYKKMLEKLVAAEGAKRGDGSKVDVDSNSNLMDNLALDDLKSQQNEARAKLSKARNEKESVVAKPTLRLASQIQNGSKLVIRKPGLRAPSSSSKASLSTKLLKKKPMVSKGKLAMRLGAKDENHEFASVEQTQKEAKETEEELKQLKTDEELARRLHDELNDGTTPSTSCFTTVSPMPSSIKPASIKSTTNGTASSVAEKTSATTTSKKVGMENHISKMKNMTGDFFSGM